MDQNIQKNLNEQGCPNEGFRRYGGLFLMLMLILIARSLQFVFLLDRTKNCLTFVHLGNSPSRFWKTKAIFVLVELNPDASLPRTSAEVLVPVLIGESFTNSSFTPTMYEFPWVFPKATWLSSTFVFFAEDPNIGEKWSFKFPQFRMCGPTKIRMLFWNPDITYVFHWTLWATGYWVRLFNQTCWPVLLT